NPSFLSRKLLMGNDLYRICHGLASPPSSWRNSKRTMALCCYCPSSSCFPKVAQTCYILLHICYVSCYVSATYLLRFLLHISYKTAGPASFWHQGMRLAHVRSLDDGPAPTASCQIDPGESCRTAERQASASLSYPANRQVLPNPHVGRPGF